LRSRVPVLIAGAGLAGLSTAHHLASSSYRLIEREPEVGGLCRSIRKAGFTFDYTGHLLHLRRPEMRKLVAELLPEGSMLAIDRRSGIHSHGVFTEYPFQVNTYGLPLSVVRDCVNGFAEVMQHSGPPLEDPSFADWATATFGAGIARHFMVPYNEKLFRVGLDEMTADWVSWSIPRPTWADVVRGALGENRRTFGYNPQFLYPADGGIDHLPRALAARVARAETGVGIEAIDLSRKEAMLSTGERVAYERLVSTLPLRRLLSIIDEVPSPVQQAAAALRAVSVLNLNLGFDRPCSLPYHWIYFPEARLPFYRVGVYSNLAPASSPTGCSSFYVEISHRPEHPIDVDHACEASAAALCEVGLVPDGAALLVASPVEIPVAYVIHDRARRAALPLIHAFLESHGIRSTGRYGNWEYAAMEDALWQGREAAAWCEKG